MSRAKPTSRPRLVVGVTIGSSAHSLLRGQLAWFREQGWEVTLVSTPDDLAVRTAEREGVHLTGIPMHRGISPGKDLVALGRWLLALRRIRPRAVSVGTPKAALLGVLAAWISRVPRRLYVVRGLRLESSSGMLEKILWAMERLTMTLATDVFFVSQSLAEESSRRRLLPWRKAWLIGAGSSNGVDAEAVADRVERVDRAAVRRRLGLGSNDFTVGFIGRVIHDKGADTLLRACGDRELDPQVKVLMIGALEEPQLQSAMDAMRERVVHVPWTDDVWGHLPAIDVLCLPTLREGFPNVVLEASVVGIPTITTRATGAIDVVADGETGILIDVGDTAALTARVNQLAGDPELVRRLGDAARRRALEDFHPTRIWRGMVEILDQCSAPEHAINFNDWWTQGSQPQNPGNRETP